METLKSIRVVALAASLATLGGCSSFKLPWSSEDAARVPANPPGFGATAAPTVDPNKALQAERDALAYRVAAMGAEIEQLKLLFALRTTPLDEPPRAAAVAPPARLPAQVAGSPPADKPSAPTASQAAVRPSAVAQPVAPAAAPPMNYTTLFKFASASIDESAKAAIAALKPQLASAHQVVVQAFADASGDAGRNKQLAQARAASVQRELLDLGVPRDKIVLSATVGDSKPAEHSTILGLFRAPDATGRRVDLTLIQVAQR